MNWNLMLMVEIEWTRIMVFGGSYESESLCEAAALALSEKASEFGSWWKELEVEGFICVLSGGTL